MKKTTKAETPKTKVKVLYQNLNGIWYAFAHVGGEIFYTPVDYKTIQQKSPASVAEQIVAKRKKSLVTNV